MTKQQIAQTISALKELHKKNRSYLQSLEIEKIESIYIFEKECKTKRYNKLTTKVQRKKHLIEYLKKEQKKEEKQEIEKLNEILNDNRIITEIRVIVYWSKNRTWGMCPHCDCCISYLDGGFENLKGESATGCGYDKLSTTIANAFNKNTSMLKLLYNKKLPQKNTAQMRYWEGGVGISSFISILKKLDFEVTREDYKSLDVLHAIKKTKKTR